MEIDVTPNIPFGRKVKRRVREILGAIAGRETDNATGRSKAEERMIRRMTEKGGEGFRILPSRETTIKNYKRPTEK